MNTATYINDSEFDTLLTSETVFVVDCTASWCGPCKKISPLIDQLAEEYQDRVKVVKLDISENKETATKFSIRSIPAVMFFKSSELVENVIGVSPYETYKTALDKLL
ncbi:thioredoxin [Dapis sp. BLCC M229]|uniref:thioredoxin n=1 Tax=Dapis sp. BLCC M229 TaxID=3400188 RepID=UPI003CF92F5D